MGQLPQTTGVGLDISPAAIRQAKALAGQSVQEQEILFVEGDIRLLPAPFKRSFSWLVEHTCFCALEPAQRKDYVAAAAMALQKGGRIFGIFYLTPDTESGPPFAISKEELSALFDPHFVLLEEWIPRESFPGRRCRHHSARVQVTISIRRRCIAPMVGGGSRIT